MSLYQNFSMMARKNILLENLKKNKLAFLIEMVVKEYLSRFHRKIRSWLRKFFDSFTAPFSLICVNETSVSETETVALCHSYN